MTNSALYKLLEGTITMSYYEMVSWVVMFILILYIMLLFVSSHDPKLKKATHPIVIISTATLSICLMAGVHMERERLYKDAKEQIRTEYISQLEIKKIPVTYFKKVEHAEKRAWFSNGQEKVIPYVIVFEQNEKKASWSLPVEVEYTSPRWKSTLYYSELTEDITNGREVFFEAGIYNPKLTIQR